MEEKAAAVSWMFNLYEDYWAGHSSCFILLNSHVTPVKGIWVQPAGAQRGWLISQSALWVINPTCPYFPTSSLHRSVAALRQHREISTFSRARGWWGQSWNLKPSSLAPGPTFFTETWANQLQRIQTLYLQTDQLTSEGEKNYSIAFDINDALQNSEQVVRAEVVTGFTSPSAATAGRLPPVSGIQVWSIKGGSFEKWEQRSLSLVFCSSLLPVL